MIHKVNIDEAKSHFADLIATTEKGGVIITDNGKALARLIPATDAAAYMAHPPTAAEFSTDDDPRRWLGELRVKRGEIRWYTFRSPDKRRPVLILTRDEVIDESERNHRRSGNTNHSRTNNRVLTTEDGMPVTCALNFDHISLAQRDRLGSVISRLPDNRWSEVQSALMIGCGFS